MILKFSDFEKSTKDGNKKCRDCVLCKDHSFGGSFAKCAAMHLGPTGYAPVPQNDQTGFGFIHGAYISLLIGNGSFPNSDGHCIYYKPTWWVKLFKGHK